MSVPAIRLEGITKAYRTGPALVPVPVLQGVDLCVAEAQSVAVTGASGSGKSTLMHIVGLLDQLSSGRVEIGGHEVGEMSDDEMASMRNACINRERHPGTPAGDGRAPRRLRGAGHARPEGRRTMRA